MNAARRWFVVFVAVSAILASVAAVAQDAPSDPSTLFGVWKGQTSGGRVIQTVTVTIKSQKEIIYRNTTPEDPQGLRELPVTEIIHLDAVSVRFRYQSLGIHGGRSTAEVSLQLRDGMLVGQRLTPGEPARYLELRRQ